MSISFEQFNTFVKEVTQETSKIIIEAFKSQKEYWLKEDNSVVTQTDLLIEEYLRGRILEKFPSHGILGEEFENQNDTSDNCWVLDPIDGTNSFIHGVPLFGTLIGFLDKGFPKYGSIQFPCLNNELLIGESSKCYLNNNLLKRKNFSSWEKSLILTTDERRISKSRFYHNWLSMKELNGMCRTWGDCYGYYLLCTGRADVMFDIDLKPYDILPILPILSGCGMKILDLSEESDYTTIVACKPEISSTINEIFR